MHLVETEISKPTDDGAFEKMCARIYGEVFGDKLPTINGRRGQAQAGIDVFVNTTEGRIGIQCKRYADGRLTIDHVKTEVDRADKAGIPIIRLIVATTATSDAKLLRAVQDLSDARKASQRFSIDIQFWQDICGHIRSRGALQADYAPNDPGGGIYEIERTATATREGVARIEAALQLSSGLPGARADSLNKLISQQLDDVNEQLKKWRFADALESLRRIGRDLSPFDPHQRARWYLQHGVCVWNIDSADLAAQDFLRASEIYPDDEKMAAAKIRGLLLHEEVDEALAAGQQAIARFPESVHVWVAYANARVIKGDFVKSEEVPHSMRGNPDVLQLLAWGCRYGGQTDKALQFLEQALDSPDAGYFTRATALAIALEAATTDRIRASYGLLRESERKALTLAVEQFEPRADRLWPVQSPQSLADTLLHLGYGYIFLGRTEEALALAAESRYREVFSPRLMRVELVALRHLDRTGELVDLARQYLPNLDEETLLLVAETAADVGDVSLVEEVTRRAEKLTFSYAEAPDVLRAMRWLALWRATTGRQQALREVGEAKLAEHGSLELVCAGARVLHAGGAEDEAEVVIERAKGLVTASSSARDRLMLAELLGATEHFADAVPLYESLVISGRHSELHNRLLTCYVRTGARRKARDLLASFPEGWTSDDGARSLAVELGQRAGDWTFLDPLAEEEWQRRPDKAGSWLFRMLVDLKLKKLARFQHALSKLPPVLKGSIRQTAQLASLAACRT